MYLTQINIIQAVVFSFYMISIYGTSKGLIQKLSAKPELIDQLIVIYSLAIGDHAILL